LGINGGMSRPEPSRLRQQFCRLREERNQLEEDILEIRALFRGSLVGHMSLRGGERRREPAYYVSRLDGGRRRFVYVRKSELERVRSLVEAYRRYQRGLRRLRGISEEALKALGALRESQDMGAEG
jgi:uncharacterized protein YjiS (DUF1127 family)